MNRYYFVCSAVLSRFAVVLVGTLLLLLFRSFTPLFVERSAVYFDDSIEEDDYF